MSEPVQIRESADGALAMLFVHSDRWGSGIGSALLLHVFQEHGVTTVDVNERNEQAVAFYRHAGFEITGSCGLP